MLPASACQLCLVERLNPEANAVDSGSAPGRNIRFGDGAGRRFNGGFFPRPAGYCAQELTKIAERIAARAAKDYARGDAIRDELAALGVALHDTRDGGTDWSVQD